MAQNFFSLSKIYDCLYFRPFSSLSGIISAACSLVCQPTSLPVTLVFVTPTARQIAVTSPVLGFLTACPGCSPGFSQVDWQLHLPSFYSHLLQSLPPNRTSLSSPEHILLFNSVLLLTLVPLTGHVLPTLPCSHTPPWLLPNPKELACCHLLCHIFLDTQPPWANVILWPWTAPYLLYLL